MAENQTPFNLDILHMKLLAGSRASKIIGEEEVEAMVRREVQVWRDVKERSQVEELRVDGQMGVVEIKGKATCQYHILFSHMHTKSWVGPALVGEFQHFSLHLIVYMLGSGGTLTELLSLSPLQESHDPRIPAPLAMSEPYFSM